MKLNSAPLSFSALSLMSVAAAIAADPITVLRLEQPVKPREAIEVAERLGQIQFAISQWGFLGNRDKLDLLVKKQMEGGAGGNGISWGA